MLDDSTIKFLDERFENIINWIDSLSKEIEELKTKIVVLELMQDLKDNDDSKAREE